MSKFSNEITISIVSHGHRDLVFAIAKQLAVIPLNIPVHLIITINSVVLEDFDQIEITRNSLTEVTLIKNPLPQGFGANHNQAFKHCSTDFFCVVNPDIELSGNPFTSLKNAFANPEIGLAYPEQIDEKSAMLDFERDLASPISIARRHVLNRRDRTKQYRSVHWASGAFMMFRSKVFIELGGFDERYFMYCEDVDICLRMQLAGYRLARADATVIHHTQRQTLKNPKHLAWHIRSLLRLWNSAAYKEYKQKFINSR
jgi:N-acetylglucosaminyl-diphospho-decaprenol L-rhamnosyltransferase